MVSGTGNHALLFLPSLYRFLNNCFGCFFRRITPIVRQNYTCCFFVRNEFPDAIWGQNYELVTLHEIHLKNFGRGNDTHLCCGLISKRTSHSQAWNVFFEMPHAQGSQRIPLHVSVRLHSSAIPQNTGFFIGLIRLVISVKGNCNYLVVRGHLPYQNCPGISNVCTKDFCSNNENRNTGWSAESKINFRFVEKGVLNLDKTSV